MLVAASFADAECALVCTPECFAARACRVVIAVTAHTASRSSNLAESPSFGTGSTGDGGFPLPGHLQLPLPPLPHVPLPASERARSESTTFRDRDGHHGIEMDVTHGGQGRSLAAAAAAAEQGDNFSDDDEDAPGPAPSSKEASKRQARAWQ